MKRIKVGDKVVYHYSDLEQEQSEWVEIQKEKSGIVIKIRKEMPEILIEFSDKSTDWVYRLAGGLVLSKG
jgi:regulation of enolase protein 1 (concanavalin A-like superfamily)